jgi:hypothetical protein
MMEPYDANDAPVLFYTSSRRIFRSILIGHLYQVCQSRKVVLLTEELDSEIDRLLLNRSLFPGLIEQVKIGQFECDGEGLVARQKRMSNLAFYLIESWKPSVVYVPGVNLFEHYLRRYAKQEMNALTIDCIGWLGVRSAREIPLLLDLTTAETQFPAWLPRVLRLALARSRRLLSQLVFYVLTPMMAGKAPFWGVNGIYRLDYTKLLNADVSIVFTRANEAMLVSEGALADKITVLPHPMKTWLPQELRKSQGIRIPNVQKRGAKIITCFLDIEIHGAFARDTLEPISDKSLYASRIEIIKTIKLIMTDWEIRIKPHPMSGGGQNYKNVQHEISQISDDVTWVSPDEPAENHILSSMAIIGFPPASAALYSATIMRSGIPIIMVDVKRELRGDGFVGVDGIVTVSSLRDFKEQIENIANGVWRLDSCDNEYYDCESLEQLVITQSSTAKASIGANGIQ